MKAAEDNGASVVFFVSAQDEGCAVSFFNQNIRKGKVTHTLHTQEGKGMPAFPALVANGTLQFPDSVRQLPGTWYNNYHVNVNNFCSPNGYTQEVRFKFLNNTKTGDIFYSQLTTIGFTGRRYTSGALKGISLNANGTDYVLDTDPDADLKWMTFTARVTPGTSYLYYNGRLIFQVANGLTAPLPPVTFVGMGIFGRQASIDWFKLSDENGVVRYFEDFNDAYRPELLDASYICPAYNCDSAFVAYYNQKYKTRYTFAQLDSMSMATCGKRLDVCSYISPVDTLSGCSNLTRILERYKATYVTPSTGFVDLDLRTFSGNKTPKEGPKGVFDVNNQLIGNTINGSPLQVNQSFAAIWNSSAENRIVGTLEALSNGGFRLHLNAGQIMPCQGIIGMRFYQFDAPDSYIDGILTGPGSYIDFADGTKMTITQPAANPNTDINIFNSAGGYTIPDGMGYYVTHRFPNAMERTVTVYHSDIRGLVGFDNWNPADASTMTRIKNLRGYMPQETRHIIYHSTQDSTINTFRNIANWSQIRSVRLLHFMSGDNGRTPIHHVDFGSWINQPNLRVANLQYEDTILLRDVLPDIPANFKQLAFLTSPGNTYTDDVKLLMPFAEWINMQNGLKSYQVDTVLNQLARSTTKSNGVLLMYQRNEPRSAASDAAVANLKARGWYMQLPGEPLPGPVPAQKTIIDPMSFRVPLYSEFSDYVNLRLRSGYTPEQIDSLYQNLCGTNPDICQAPPPPVADNATAPRLCGGNKPVFEKLTYIPDPCKDLDKMAYTYTEERMQYYADSIRNVFDTAYYNASMNARSRESFTVTYQSSEYHYTLYYYDQAGNLVKTVPPAGVEQRYTQGFLDSVKTARADALKNGYTIANRVVPQHTLVTRYRYNTLNQVVTQKTPDAGISNFWYDALGRLVVSQNAQQALADRFSYTIYDALGRITEVGQKPKPNGGMNQNLTRDSARLSNWLNNNQKREQITRTVYDVGYYAGETPSVLDGALYQRNLRNRVSYTQVFDIEPSGDAKVKWIGNHTAATYYTYDIHGNVDTLAQDYNNPVMRAGNSRYKKIAYNYDLISGKVNKVSYQSGWPDAFYHKYKYDAENRLTDVETSTDDFVWEKDARYFYYKHGPLARTILGQNQVQGIDYAYTLQGWLKGVNSTNVGDGSFDMGGDGKAGSENSNIGRDAYGFALSYFNGDFKPIGNSQKPFANAAAAGFGFKGLYNGNIAAMGVNIPKIGEPLLYTYTYDQLNRITKMFTYKGLNPDTNNWNVSAVQNYREQVSYDANGNILTYKRNGNAARINMDDLTYSYKPGTNKLDKVTDAAPDAAAGEYDKYNDIKQGQQNGNYQYDEIGNLISDASEGITKIEWTVYGKISKITKSNGTAILYSYGASGNRISKSVNGKETWYVRDASGNVMSVYSKDAGINNGNLSQTEIHLYGSSRLGVLNLKNNVEQPDLNPARILTFTRGRKFFELSNHLGNVLATVSDKKIAFDANGDGYSDYFTPDVVSAQDYYPFGLLMPGRKYSIANTNYRYGFNGKELDKEVSGTTTYDYGFRIYNPGLGRFLSVDPLAKEYPELTPYQFGSNTPIQAIDQDGLEAKPANKGEAEGQTETTTKTDYARLHNIPKTVSATWHWHEGRLKTGRAIKDQTGKLVDEVTKAGWYSSEQYVNVLSHSLAARELAALSGYSTRISNTAVGFEELSGFVGTGISVNAAKHLDAAAMKVANAENYAVTGSIKLSTVNVEDIVGLGLLAKGGIKAITRLAMAKEAAKTSSRAFFSGAGAEARALNEGFTTLSQTRAGQNLMRMTEGMPYYPGSQAYNWWARLSSVYAKGIRKGSNVNVFLNNPSPTGIWNAVEKPILLQRKINIIYKR